MREVGPVLEDILNRLGLRRREQQHRAIALWPQVVGPSLSAHARARRFDGGTLVVATSGPAWAQQVGFMKAEIICRLNARLGDGGHVVKDIRTYTARLAPSDTGDKAPDRPQPGGGGGARQPLSAEQRQMVLSVWSESAGLDISVRRRLVALATLKHKRDSFLVSRGWKTCASCGSATPPQRGGEILCASCRVEREPVLESIKRVLAEAPWLDAEGVKCLEPRSRRGDYGLAREVLVDRWRKEIASTQGEDGWPGRAVDLVMLLTGKPVDELSERDFKRVLKPAQARMALRALGRQDVAPREEGST